MSCWGFQHLIADQNHFRQCQGQLVMEAIAQLKSQWEHLIPPTSHHTTSNHSRRRQEQGCVCVYMCVYVCVLTFHFLWVWRI